VAELYLQRWTIENAFQEIEQALRSEINTLGYPARPSWAYIAVLTYNALSLAKWAIEIEQGDSITREQLSATTWPRSCGRLRRHDDCDTGE